VLGSLPHPQREAIVGSFGGLDGNHRVSVARFQGVEMIDAVVTEFYPRLYANLEHANNMGVGCLIFDTTGNAIQCNTGQG
jgi:hypothetical protein